MSSFRKSLDLLEDRNPELGSKLFLYLHTSYPDAGWDIPELLKENRLTNKVLFTYVCKKCNTINCSTFVGASKVCGKCLEKSMVMPSVTNGINTTQLSMVYNLFDIYVQYSICEGFGMPQVEAASCGVPIASTDYSAMSDVVRKLNGYPIKIKQYFKELETRAVRVYPDDDSLVQILLEFSSMPLIFREQKSFETRQLAEQHYDWDLIAKKWEDYFDSIELINLQGRWNIPLGQLQNVENPKGQITDNYDWLFTTLNTHLPNHQLQSSMIMMNILKNLDYGFITNGMQTSKYDTGDAVSMLNSVINNNNAVGKAQNNKHLLSNEDYISYAHMKDQTNDSHE
jgi:hypothetical protein